MAQTPQFKVFDASGAYQAACKEIEAAAALIGFYGDGSTIRIGHSRKGIVWSEGDEEESAAESYDMVSEIVSQRLKERANEFYRVFPEFSPK